ncbi:PIN domain-containing protein [Microbacterium phyllosphaerae]|uniref:PIN domain-containing protein n=1 Tax=Microbacterium phyllosphaerae TaxID=124798 RepID=UPI0021694275|nr:PIN domain-containing protein [Microbacterium phyllosphaerae]MCS3442451.1 hypothetical protein [Microbacterium phyllosphaerae]
MKTLVLDTTELRRDWTFKSMTVQLLGHAVAQTIIDVTVPSPVVEEIVAHHGRACIEALAQFERAAADCRRLGLDVPELAVQTLDYRSFISELWDDLLGISVLPWPTVDHSSLVARATSRRPPFDDKGGGYRDSLVWESALQLARDGRDVVLVSNDKAFSDGDTLAQALAEELVDLPGTVELVRELAPWLVNNLPWASESVGEAVLLARDEIFLNYFFQSDFQSDLEPDAASIGFEHSPLSFGVTGVEWGGSWSRASARHTGAGTSFAEYEIDEVVSVVAEIPDHSKVPSSWKVLGEPHAGFRRVEGEVRMYVTIGVFFGNDSSFDFESQRWRREDGVAPGPGVEPLRTGTPLFEL